MSCYCTLPRPPPPDPREISVINRRSEGVKLLYTGYFRIKVPRHYILVNIQDSVDAVRFRIPYHFPDFVYTGKQLDSDSDSNYLIVRAKNMLNIEVIN